MARPETTKKRVFNLVGRFEQLAQACPIQEYIQLGPKSPTSPRPASHHGEKTWMPQDRRTLSLSSMPNSSTLSARLERELNRNAQLRQEIESLRRRCNEDDEMLTTLSKRLEEGTELQASLHMQTSGLQTKVDRLADKLARRDKTQKAEYERRIVAVVNERDILASKLRMAEASVERARAVEDTIKTADEKIRVAEERAQTASSQVTAVQKQLLDLKTDIAARSGQHDNVSDQEILDMMNKLNHLVQNWCVNSFRKVKIGMYLRNNPSCRVLTCFRSTQDGLQIRKDSSSTRSKAAAETLCYFRHKHKNLHFPSYCVVSTHANF